MSVSQRYAMMMDLSGRSCLVVGGGHVAERKTFSLLEAGAQVKVVSLSFSDRLLKKESFTVQPPACARDAESTSRDGQASLQLIHSTYRSDLLNGMFLVIAATDQYDVNRQVCLDAKERGILINCADNPELSDFWVPAVLRRGPLTLAVSTSGASPSLSRHIKQELSECYGSEYDEYVQFLQRFRHHLLQANRLKPLRRKLLKAVLHYPVLDWIRAGRSVSVTELIEIMLDDMGQSTI